jgi:hypothetical protein
VTTDITPWKASADVFAVTQPAAALIDRMRAAVSTLQFASADPKCEFYPLTRITQARVGPALVVTDVAEYEGGARQSAVVVSAVVHDDEAAGERLVVIRTHLEDQHTRHEGDIIVFDEHHDAIRAALIGAVVATDPDAEHRRRPEPGAEPEPDTPESVEPAESVGPIHTPKVERARQRTQAVIDEPVAAGGIDLRQIAGIALMIVGFVVLLIAIAIGSLTAIIVGIAVAIALGFAGNRVAGS